MTGLWTNEEIQWATDQLARFTYKPGWKLWLTKPLTEWDDCYLALKFTTDDSRNPGHKIEIGSKQRLPHPIVQRRDEERFGHWLQVQIMKVERHESQEWLRRDGAIFNDPHRENA